MRKTPFVLPTDDFFPPKNDAGTVKAERMFQRVKELADMSDWPCKLVAIDSRAPAEVSIGLGQVYDCDNAAGTFSVEGQEKQEVIVRYDANLADQPVALVGTFAHELAHYLMATGKTWGPGGIDLHEHTTDALAVHMGFGLFLANSAFEAGAWSDGLSAGHGYRRQGYLSESELIYALALFLKINNLEFDSAKPYLKKRLATLLDHALKDLEAIETVEDAAMQAWTDYKVTEHVEPMQ